MSNKEGLETIRAWQKDKNWICVGNDRQMSYFHEKRLQFPLLTHPGHWGNCVCGHPITNNYYIYNTLLHVSKCVGSECIEGFTHSKLHKTCRDCGNSHRNRSDDFCNDCRKKQPKKIRYRDCRDCSQEIRYVPHRTRCRECWDAQCYY